MNITSIRQFKSLMLDQLKDLYPETEIHQMGKLALQEVLKITPTQLLLWPDNEINELQSDQLMEICARLANTEPLQYILGYTEFYDLKLKVSPAVLIPRSETEELVHWILNDTTIDKTHILDIGTGSGCIPFALKQNLPLVKIEAWDISDEALALAKQNSKDLNLDVTFKKVDVLSIKETGEFTCIVSNPPYVRELEKTMMAPNVLKHEPHLALFVDDDDPLLFYKAIANLGIKALKHNGALFFEINEYLSVQMINLLEELGYTNIECRKDLQGKDRMMKAIKP